MKTPNPPMDEVLLDVRRAYRLLHDYQRMVLDAIHYLGRQLELPYIGGWPKFSDRPPTERAARPDDLQRWAWDWLNFYLYDFHFRRDTPDGASIYFSILLISDTGFFLSEAPDASETQTADFLPSERSQTLIGVIMSAKDWPGPQFMETRERVKTFIETGGELHKDQIDAGLVAKCYPLSRLSSEASASQLVDEIVLFAKSQGIPLSRISDDPNPSTGG